MTAMLAFFGAVIELAEIPTIIWLVYTVLKQRRQLEKMRRMVTTKAWERGEHAPPSAMDE